MKSHDLFVGSLVFHRELPVNFHGTIDHMHTVVEIKRRRDSCTRSELTKTLLRE